MNFSVWKYTSNTSRIKHESQLQNSNKKTQLFNAYNYCASLKHFENGQSLLPRGLHSVLGCWQVIQEEARGGRYVSLLRPHANGVTIHSYSLIKTNNLTRLSDATKKVNKTTRSNIWVNFLRWNVDKNSQYSRRRNIGRVWEPSCMHYS